MPGIDGYFGVMENHAAMISALGAGKITVEQVNGITPSKEDTNNYMDEAKDQRFTFDVKGGVAEVFHNKVIVLLD